MPVENKKVLCLISRASQEGSFSSTTTFDEVII